MPRIANRKKRPDGNARFLKVNRGPMMGFGWVDSEMRWVKVFS